MANIFASPQTAQVPSRVIRELPQRGTSNRIIDLQLRAKASGKRVSQTGNVYWETRRNRSDKKGTRL
jgi:hypothetical protein